MSASERAKEIDEEVLKHYHDDVKVSPQSVMNTALGIITEAFTEYEREIERLKKSMEEHFIRDHLEGDGPEIDRWRNQNKSLQAKVEELTGDNRVLTYNSEALNKIILDLKTRNEELEKNLENLRISWHQQHESCCKAQSRLEVCEKALKRISILEGEEGSTVAFNWKRSKELVNELRQIALTAIQEGRG